MNTIKCGICFENLQKPTEDRGGIRVAVCGHPFHTICITEVVRLSTVCPTCGRIIIFNEMNPLYLPNDNVQPPIYVKLHPHLILRHGQIDLINIRFARIEIYPNSIDNQIEDSNKCGICLESLIHPEENRGGVRVTRCGHAFHTNCTVEIIRNAPVCPNCRRGIHVGKINPLFLQESRPIYDQIHQQMRIRRNGIDLVNFHNVRAVIYANQ